MKKLLLVVAVIAALALGLALLTGAGAQDGERPGERFIAKLAEKLGISQEELTTAMREAQFELIDEAVAEGRLSEEQAQKLKERVEEYGPLSLLGRARGHGDDRAHCRAAKLVLGAAAHVLDRERGELAQALRSGQSLAGIAEAQGMSLEDFKIALLGQVKSHLDKRVESGEITRERADKLFQGLRERIDQIVNSRPEPGHKPCGRRGHQGPPESAPGRGPQQKAAPLP